MLPVLSVNRPRHATARTTAVIVQTLRGRGAIRLPILAQKPVEVGSAEPYDGRAGQKTQRPTITSRAGRSVSMTISVTTTPIAATGPRPAVEFISATSS